MDREPDASPDALHRALLARGAGLLSESLRERTVLVAGLGSVGSYLAEQLVRSGVGALALLDPERVEAANLSRSARSIASRTPAGGRRSSSGSTRARRAAR